MLHLPHHHNHHLCHCDDGDGGGGDGGDGDDGGSDAQRPQSDEMCRPAGVGNAPNAHNANLSRVEERSPNNAKHQVFMICHLHRFFRKMYKRETTIQLFGLPHNVFFRWGAFCKTKPKL